MKYIKKIFGRKSLSAKKKVVTIPLKNEQLRRETTNTIHIHPAQILSGCAQSIGMQREHNEDTCYMMQTVLSSNEGNIPIGLFIIADGMGGHQFGDIASDVASKAVINKIGKEIIKIQNESNKHTNGIQKLLEKSVIDAHREVLSAAPGGGTTLTVLFTLGKQAHIAHVGDSRIYFFYMDGRIEIITHDHSLVQRLIELGQITKDEAAIHPQRNVLYKALGQGDPINPDIQTTILPDDAYVLLCSDGLWGVLSDQQIFKIIKDERNLSIACNKLVAAANENGGPDNISVILVKYFE